MDLVAGAGGIFGQLAVGLAGGLTDASAASQLMPNGIKMAGKFGPGGGGWQHLSGEKRPIMTLITPVIRPGATGPDLREQGPLV